MTSRRITRRLNSRLRRRTSRSLLSFETLEDRRLLAAIDWVNRGNDDFEMHYGTEAVVARQIVDRAIRDWEEAILSFNFSTGENRFELTLSARNQVGIGTSPSGHPIAIQLPFSNQPIWNSGDPMSNDPISGSEVGKPRKRTVYLDDNGAGLGWYFDTQVSIGPRSDGGFGELYFPDDGEFDQVLNRFAGRGAVNQLDFYRAASAVIGVALGLSPTTYSSVSDETLGLISPTPLKESLLETGIPNPNFLPQANQTLQRLPLNTSPPSQATFQAGWLYDGPITPAMVDAGLTSHEYDSFTYRHLLSSIYADDSVIGVRSLISDLDVAILRDVYGYSVRTPSQINTFHANYSAENRQLIITGTLGDDLIQVNYIPAGITPALVEVLVNGSREVIPATQFPRDIESIIIRGLDGNDVIQVYRDPGANVFEIDGGLGDDTISIGVGLNRFSQLTSQFYNIKGGGGDDTFIIDDRNSDGDKRPYIISGSVFTRTGDDTVIGFDNIDQIFAFTNSEETIINVGDIPENVQINVLDRGGEDIIVIGEAVGKRLDGSNGKFLFEPLLGSSTGNNSNRVVFDDQNSTLEKNYVLSTFQRNGSNYSSMSIGGGTNNIGPTWDFRGVAAAVINGSSQSSSFDVQSTLPGVKWTIQAGAGNDVLEVAPLRFLGFLVGGNLAALRSDIDFRGGGGNDQIILNDTLNESSSFGDATPRNYQTYNNRVEIRSVPSSEFDPFPTVFYSQTETIRMLGGGGDDFFIVNSSNSQTTLHLHGNVGDDTFTIGTNDLFADFLADIYIDGGAGSDRINLNDQAAAIRGGYVFGTETAGDGVLETTFEKLSIFFVPFPIAYQSGMMNSRGIERIDLQGSAQGDFFDVNGTPAGMTYNLFGNGGDDDFRINGSNLLSRINVRGGLPTTAPGDRLRVYGTREDTGSYLPGASSHDGRVTANGQMIDFTGLEPVYVEGFGSFAFVTPRSRDIIDITQYPDPTDNRLWTQIGGTSGLQNTPFEVLRVLDIGTLEVNLVAFDLIPEPPFNAFDPSDRLTIFPNALSGHRVDVLRVFAGLGNDLISDRVMQGAPATTHLEVIAAAPNVRHEFWGTPYHVDLGTAPAASPPCGPSTARAARCIMCVKST
jgi:hypothetical protein